MHLEGDREKERREGEETLYKEEERRETKNIHTHPQT